MADTQVTESVTEVETPEATDAAKKLEDMEINFDTEDDDDSSDETDSSDDDQAQDDDTDEEDESDSDKTDESTDDSDDTEESEDDDSTQDSKKAKDPKTPEAARNKEMYERRQKEKQARDAQAKTLADEQQAYLEEAGEDENALALRQLQIDAYDAKIERNTTKLQTGYERAVKDFDILRSDNPLIQAEVNDALDAFQAQYVTIDKYGNPSQLKPGADMYAYLQRKADSLDKLTGIGKKTQEQNKSREKSKTMVTPGRAPKAGKTDSDMDAFMEEAKR